MVLYMILLSSIFDAQICINIDQNKLKDSTRKFNFCTYRYY